MYYSGDMTINPDSDVWMDTKRVDASITYDTSAYDSAIAQLGIDKQTGFSEVNWGAWETNWVSEEVSETYVETTVEALGNIHPDDLPEGVQTNLQHIANYQKVLELNGKWVPKGAGVITDAELITKTYHQDVEISTQQSREGIQYQVTPKISEQSLGDRLLSRDIIPYMRERNIEITTNRMKPRTRFYVFFDNVDVTRFVTPKLIEINMTSGVFQTGETVKSGDFSFRLAAPNHKEGPYNAPTKVLTLNPYDNAAGVPATYSTASTLVNIDTASLADISQSDYYGFSSEGLRIKGRSSGAEATVTKKRLITDTLGNLKCCFMIPDPNQPDNPQFETGTKTLRVTTSPTNSTIAGTVTGSAECNYYAKGELETVQENVLSIKVPQIERLTPEEQQVVQGRIETRVDPNASDRDFSAVGADGAPVVITGCLLYTSPSPRDS